MNSFVVSQFFAVCHNCEDPSSLYLKNSAKCCQMSIFSNGRRSFWFRKCLKVLINTLKLLKTHKSVLKEVNISL